MEQGRNPFPGEDAPEDTSAAGTPSAASLILPDHVVVFVHGMGRALKGGTLQEWAQPLMLSLHDLSLDQVQDKEHPPLVITQAKAVGDAPEVWVKVFQGYRNGSPQYLNVLMTEASWDKDFEPATATSTLLWSFQTAWDVCVRSVQVVRWSLYPGKRNWASWRWVSTRALQFFLTPVAAAAGLAAMFAALLILPIVILLAKIPGVGRWVRGFVSLFADFLGDPQVWKRKPLQAAAMRQRVRDTLQRWNHGLNVDVTVVAHSQGAAITGQVLFQKSREHPDPINQVQARVTNFVTVGSGIDLLGYAQWGGSNGDDPVADWLDLKEHRPTWINVWGKFDFIPAGPIASRAMGRRSILAKIYKRDSDGDGGPGPEEQPVYNRSALIYDHVVYSRNRIEVIDPLARLIFSPAGESSGMAFRGIDSDPRLRPHRVMVKSLGVTRLLAIMTGIIGAPAALAWLGSMGWSRSMVQCGAPGAGQDPWWSSWLCSGARYNWSNWMDLPVLGLTAVVIGGVLIGLLNGPVWGLLHSGLERRHMPSKRQSSDPTRRLPGNPWEKVAGYLITVAGVELSLLLLIWPDWWWFLAFASAGALWAACFTRTDIAGLAPRPPKPQPASTLEVVKHL